MGRRKTEFSKFKYKRGSYIIEAAVILPVIILVTITSMMIVMFFYNQMIVRSQLHIALRNEAGVISGQTMYVDAGGDISDIEFETHCEKGLLGGTVYGKKYLIMEHEGILNKKGTFTATGENHIIDGPDYVRYRQLVEGIKNEE